MESIAAVRGKPENSEGGKNTARRGASPRRAVQRHRILRVCEAIEGERRGVSPPCSPTHGGLTPRRSPKTRRAYAAPLAQDTASQPRSKLGSQPTRSAEARSFSR